jgi:hypothetical protein
MTENVENYYLIKKFLPTILKHEEENIAGKCVSPVVCSN